jgi:hypothetical protein
MKKNFMSAILIATLVTMAPAAFAGINKDNKKSETTKSTSSNKIQVQYVSGEDDAVVLQVKLAKADNRTALMRITDGSGEVLYTERISDKSFARYIQVSPEELKSIEIVFDTFEGTSRKRYNLNYTSVSNFKMEEVTIK